MGLKLRNVAQDASVTLIDGGLVGSPSYQLDVRTLGATGEVGGKGWKVVSTYEAGDLVTYPRTFLGGFTLDEYFVSQVDNNTGNNPDTDIVNWRDAKLVRYVSTNIEFTVGAIGDFTKLDTALEYLARLTAVDGARISIKILTGTVIDYKILLEGGDFSAVDITSQDSSVNFTADLPGNDEYVIHFSNCKAPNIYMDMDYNGVSSYHNNMFVRVANLASFTYNGIMTTNTGEIIALGISSGALVKVSTSNIINNATRGTAINCSGGCTLQGFNVAVSCPHGIVGEFLVSAKQNSNIDIGSSQINGSGNNRGIFVSTGSTVNAFNANFSLTNGAADILQGGTLISSTAANTNITANTLTSDGIWFK